MGAMSTPSSRINLHGAVDLGALAAQQQAQQQAKQRAAARAAGQDNAQDNAQSTAQNTAQPSAAPAVVVDVTEATFKPDVVDRSFEVPVVVDLWATWCGPCTTLSPILERLAQEYAGRFILAKVDVDANPQISQAFRVQSIPTVVAVLMGQPVPLFTGALPEPQVRAYLDELLRIAAEQGLTGSAPVGDEAAVAQEPEDDPRFDAAFDAIERGDYDAAEAAYREALAAAPGDPEAAAGLAQVGLLRRTEGIDPDEALTTAVASPGDVAAAMRAADALVLHGRSTEAFSVLIAVIRSAAGDDREGARVRLLELFDIVGPDDPAVPPARIALANALF
jgi:putative thioredoxin